MQTAEYVKAGEYIELGGLYRVYAEAAGDRVKLIAEPIITRPAPVLRSGPLSKRLQRGTDDRP